MAWEIGNLQLIDFSVEDDCLIPYPFRDFSVTPDDGNECNLFKSCGGGNSRLPSQSVERRSLSVLRESIGWDGVFCTSAGPLNPEELCMINQGFKKAECTLSSSGTKNHTLAKRLKVSIRRSGSACRKNNVRNKTWDAGADLSLSKRSPRGYLSSKSTTSISPTTVKNSMVHRSNGSSSSASPKCIERKNNLRNTNLTNSPSSVLSSLSSTCSSSTSPGSSGHNVILSSDFQSSRESVKERKFSQHATISSMRKVKSSGLRMPSPKIGFFDEDQPIFEGSMHRLNKYHPSYHSPLVSTENCSTLRKALSREHDGRKVGASYSKLKTNGQKPREISKNRMNIDGKSREDDSGLFEGKTMIDSKKKQERRVQCLLESKKQNECCFEDHLNGFGGHLEVTDLYRDPTEVKGQRSSVKRCQPSLPAEHSTSSSRTLFSEKMVGPRKLSFWRKSLDWDSAFFTSAGLLNSEELCMMNKGFKKAESNQPFLGTRKDIQPHQVSGWNQTSSLDRNSFHLESLEGSLFKDELPMQLISRGSMNDCFGGQSPCPSSNETSLEKFHPSHLSPSVSNLEVSKTLNGEHDGRRDSESCRKMKNDGQIHNKISKNSMHIKKKQDDSESQKQNVFCVDEQVNVKGQLSHSPNAEHSTIFSRTPSTEHFLVTSDNVNECDCIKLFGDVNSHVQSEPMGARRISFLHKNLDWDYVFSTSAGFLSPDGMCMINKGLNKSESNELSSPGTQTDDIQPHQVSGEGFHVETFEDDLFKDVNPEIHKLNKSSKVSANITCNQSKMECRTSRQEQVLRGDLPSESTKTSQNF